jgi:hypothetical protein
VVTAAAQHAAETRLLWAARLKAEMVRSELPVALRTMVARMGRDPRELPPRALAGLGSGPSLLLAAVDGLIEGVSRFDPLRGGRLAATASIAVDRAVTTWLRENGMDRAGGAGAAGRATPRSDTTPIEDWTRRVDAWQAWLEPEEAVAAWVRAGDQSDGERRVLAMRYGLDGGPPRTPAEVARVLKTTPTRVSAMERTAVARILGRKERPRG